MLPASTEPFFLALTALAPGTGGFEEVGGEVCLFNRLESRSQEKIHLRDAAGRDRGWASTESASVETFWQAGRNENIVVRHPSIRPERPPAGSQHGELGAYSSEGVSMNDCVECRVPER